jgi:hypothetical protein
MKPVLVNLNAWDAEKDACWMYVNLERLEIVDILDAETSESVVEFEFPIDEEEAEEGIEEGCANLIVSFASIREWKEYISSLPISTYQPHPEGDWKNWCSALFDGTIPNDEMYW